MCYITNIIISKKSLLILIFFIFFIFPKIVYSGDILVGNIYEGEITNFKNKKINISLPPGKWKATKSEKAERQWWDAELINTENRGELYLWIPWIPIGGAFWSGGSMERCATWMEEDAKKILSQGADRGNPQAVYCISERKDGWLHIGLESRTVKAPIYWFYYNLYYPMNKISKNAIDDKNLLKEVGKIGMDAVINSLQGNTISLNILDNLVKKSSSKSSISTNSSDSSNVSIDSSKLISVSKKEICLRATKLNGLGWEDHDSKYGEYVKEAFKRNLSLWECRQSTNRFPDVNTNIEESVSDSYISIETRLKDLKELLDEGLITKTQYDEKSSIILDEL
tara:strand:- start:582 stop:1598 length:1017 start_codon:yes stop_codon:yes gene_type:complete